MIFEQLEGDQEFLDILDSYPSVPADCVAQLYISHNKNPKLVERDLEELSYDIRGLGTTGQIGSEQTTSFALSHKENKVFNDTNNYEEVDLETGPQRQSMLPRINILSPPKSVQKYEHVQADETPKIVQVQKCEEYRSVLEWKKKRCGLAHQRRHWILKYF